jgi:hypothetical protein
MELSQHCPASKIMLFIVVGIKGHIFSLTVRQRSSPQNFIWRKRLGNHGWRPIPAIFDAHSRNRRTSQTHRFPRFRHTRITDYPRPQKGSLRYFQSSYIRLCTVFPGNQSTHSNLYSDYYSSRCTMYQLTWKLFSLMDHLSVRSTVETLENNEFSAVGKSCLLDDN